ncbi:MAG: alpha/beta hydrolase family protein [Anaerohalosphaeraceae bacterium]|nr:alpha/beta hydrolase family protein [Anaerohalosphaeraceae bacterium]
MNKFNSDNYVHVLANEVNRSFAFKAKTVEELKDWQKAFRPKLREALGIDKIENRGSCSLEPKMLSEETLDTHIRQEWSIFSEPGFEIPFFLLLPKGQTKPAPLVLTPHGHSKLAKNIYVGIWRNEAEKAEIADGDRDIALQAVEAGYVAIAPDVRGFADLRLKEDKASDESYSDRKLQMRALMFGRTLIGERVWDIGRLIDYAKTRSEIDTGKIMITGNSGGGTVSLFAAACDERIGIAVPSSYFCTFEGSIGSIRHCECNYIPGIMTMAEMYDIAGLIAPRPFLAVNGKEDKIFPIESAKYAYKKLKEIYEVAGAGEVCKLAIGNGGHRYYKDLVWDFVKEQFE